MRLSEFIIIYLTAAAPVGVSYFLRPEARPVRGARAVSRAVGAAFIWPLVIIADLLREHRLSVEPLGQIVHEGRAVESDHDDDFSIERDVEPVKRALLQALRHVEDLTPEIFGKTNEKSQPVMLSARESVERYTGLSLAVRLERLAGTSLTEREMELCRVAGRTGEDLLLAGRCVHRRNVARLVEHQQRARADLLHALAEVREMSDGLCRDAGQNALAADKFSETVFQVLNRAVALFSVLDDRPAALRASRLCEAGRARLGNHVLTTSAAANHQAPRSIAEESEATHKGATCPPLLLSTEQPLDVRRPLNPRPARQ